MRHFQFNIHAENVQTQFKDYKMSEHQCKQICNSAKSSLYIVMLNAHIIKLYERM